MSRREFYELGPDQYQLAGILIAKDDEPAQQDGGTKAANWFASWMRESKRITGRHYVNGEIRTGHEGGGALFGPIGGRGIVQGEGERPQSTKARICRIDETEKNQKPGAVLRLQNCGAYLGDIGLYGRKIPGDIRSGTGTRAEYGIALEGSAYTHCGKHTVERVTIADCEKAVAFLRTRLDAQNNSIADPNHADESTFRDMMISGCPVGFSFENPQAIGHTLENVQFMSEGIGLDIHASASIQPSSVQINAPRFTLLRFSETEGGPNLYSHNANDWPIHIYRDSFPVKDQRLTLVEINGKARDYKKFRIRITGELPHAGNDPPPWNEDELFKLNGFPGEDILLDVRGLTDSFKNKYRQLGNWLQMVKK